MPQIIRSCTSTPGLAHYINFLTPHNNFRRKFLRTAKLGAQPSPNEVYSTTSQPWCRGPPSPCISSSGTVQAPGSTQPGITSSYFDQRNVSLTQLHPGSSTASSIRILAISRWSQRRKSNLYCRSGAKESYTFSIPRRCNNCNNQCEARFKLRYLQSLLPQVFHPH
jgi:hypothetical protein